MVAAAIAGVAAPILGNLVSAYYGNRSANRDRRVKVRELEDDEKNNKFKRLIMLMDKSEEMNANNANASRLLALRNTGAIRS